MRTKTVLSALFLGAILAGSAPALNAEASIQLGDKLYGDIQSAGEFDVILFEAPVDAELKLVAKAKEEGLALTLQLFPPSDPDTPEPIDEFLSGTSTKVKLKGFVVPESGVWKLEVRAAAGSMGRYQLKTKVTYRDTWKTSDIIGASAQLALGFSARYDSSLKLKIKPKSDGVDLSVVSLDTPGGPRALPDDLEQSGIDLLQTGDYAVNIRNAGIEGSYKAKLKVKAASRDSETNYLSPEGFGPAPIVDSVDPKKALKGSVVSDVTILGAEFDEGCTVCLRRSGQDDVPALDVVRVSDEEITCSLDLDDLKTGGWDLVVRNPSGGDDEASFSVKSPDSVTLPSGIKGGTEVWYLEFADEFESDLALFGLSGNSPTVNAKAAELVKAYMLYDLREIFGLRGKDGKIRDGAVSVSFCIEQPTSLVGSPGVTYNRLRIGGEIQPGEPVSDNPDVQWGLASVDTANDSVDDLSRAGAPGRGLFLRALKPGVVTSTPAYVQAFTPLVQTPLAFTDEIYFFGNFDPVNATESSRYRDLDLAIRTLGSEMAAVAAHHIGRAMGLPNGTSGVSSTPALVGTFASLTPPTFSADELTSLAALAEPSNLAGTSKTLQVSWFRLRGLADYLLPEVVTSMLTTIELPYAGGRPDLVSTDLSYSFVTGVVPFGLFLGTRQIVGTCPFTLNTGTWYYGAFKFGLRIRDSESGDEDYPAHRINVTINLNLVPQQQQAQAIGLNVQVRTSP